MHVSIVRSRSVSSLVMAGHQQTQQRFEPVQDRIDDPPEFRLVQHLDLHQLKYSKALERHNANRKPWANARLECDAPTARSKAQHCSCLAKPDGWVPTCLFFARTLHPVVYIGTLRPGGLAQSIRLDPVRSGPLTFSMSTTKSLPGRPSMPAPVCRAHTSAVQRNTTTTAFLVLEGLDASSSRGWGY